MFNSVKTLDDLLEVKLQGLYDAEQQLVQALPAMAAKASDSRLRLSLEQHLRETKNQVSRLEQVARSLNMSLRGPSCRAMAGLIEEGEQMMALRASDEVIDAALLAAAQGVEHYEIAQYGTAVHFAKRLGHYPEAEMLQATLAEEKNTDETLNQLATMSVNARVMS